LPLPPVLRPSASLPVDRRPTSSPRGSRRNAQRSRRSCKRPESCRRADAFPAQPVRRGRRHVLKPTVPGGKIVSRTIETRVLVVGAGPVGLTLALDLAWRGIDVAVIEQRQAGDPPRIRSNHISARSMEIFRRLGLAAKVREAGLPADY